MVTVKVEGHIEASEWSSARQVELAFNINPGNNRPPLETTAYLREDSEDFYLAFDARDP